MHRVHRRHVACLCLSSEVAFQILLEDCPGRSRPPPCMPDDDPAVWSAGGTIVHDRPVSSLQPMRHEFVQGVVHGARSAFRWLAVWHVRPWTPFFPMPSLLKRFLQMGPS